jgi:hypothetical protein
MIQKINNYLVTNYPQIWNTRLAWSVIVLGTLHLLFFIAGFFKSDIIFTLHEYNLSRLYVPDDNFILSILISILFIIGWLWYYLRNNPIKSFYPVGKLYLTKEFLIILATIIFASTFFMSYANGFWARVVSITSKAELKQEIDNLNIAYGFMPQDGNNYIKENSCEAIEETYNNNQNNQKQNSSKRNSDNDNNSKSEFYNNANNNKNRNEKAQGAFFYKYYCRQYLDANNSFNILSGPQIHTAMLSCLDNEDKLKNVFTTLTATLKKYDLKYNYNYNQHVANVWAQHGTFTDAFDYKTGESQSEGFNNNETQYLDENPSSPTASETRYAAIGNLRSVLDNFQDYYNRPIRDEGGYMAFLYLLFGISGLIFTLRLISTRHFMFSIIGALLILIFSGLIIGFFLRHSDYGPWQFCALLFGLFYLIYFITKGSNKTLATLCHTWFIWLIPAVLPFLFAVINQSTNRYNYREIDVVSKWQPLIDYVEDNMLLVLGLNLVFAFIWIVFRAYFSKKLLAQAEN